MASINYWIMFCDCKNDGDSVYGDSILFCISALKAEL